jgi:hypothetical protein
MHIDELKSSNPAGQPVQSFIVLDPAKEFDLPSGQE